MTISRSKVCAIAFGLVGLAVPAAAQSQSPKWALKIFGPSNVEKGAVSATLSSTDGRARLIVRCDRASDNFPSIQFLPSYEAQVLAYRPVEIGFGENEGWRLKWRIRRIGIVAERENARDRRVDRVINELSRGEQDVIATAQIRGGQAARFVFPNRGSDHKALDAVVRACLGASGS